MHSTSIKAVGAVAIALLATASAMSTVVYSNGLTTIPESNVEPTNPISKFQASYPTMYMSGKTEFCHGIQIKKGLFVDTKYDMYVIRTKISDLGSNGVLYDFDIYSQFNNDSITMTFSWNAETGGDMTQQERTVKAIYDGICKQSMVVIRTKDEQMAINENDLTRKPVDPGNCQNEAKSLAVVNSKIAMAKVEAYLDPAKRDTFGRSSKLDRIEIATQNASVQSEHNVIMQSLLAEEAAAASVLATCKKPPKAQTATIDPLDQIRKLKTLLDDKIITQEEFDIKKAALLK